MYTLASSLVYESRQYFCETLATPTNIVHYAYYDPLVEMRVSFRA